MCEGLTLYKLPELADNTVTKISLYIQSVPLRPDFYETLHFLTGQSFAKLREIFKEKYNQTKFLNNVSFITLKKYR